MAYSDFKENPVGFVKKYLSTFAMDLVVIAISLGYVFYQMVSLTTTEQNPWVLIGKGIVSVFCGVMIKQALGENGFTKGYNSKTWQDEENKYNNACNDATEYTERLDNFNLVIEKEKIEHYRRTHLQAARMKYSMWFDQNGDYVGVDEDYVKLSWRQKRVLKKAIKVKVYTLNLFTPSAAASDKENRPEETDNGQRAKTFSSNTLTAILISAIGVYFVPTLLNWNWAEFIVAVAQVALWITMGVVQMYKNYNFVLQNRVNALKVRIKLLLRFINECRQGKHTVSPYANDTYDLPIRA